MQKVQCQHLDAELLHENYKYVESQPQATEDAYSDALEPFILLIVQQILVHIFVHVRLCDIIEQAKNYDKKLTVFTKLLVRKCYLPLLG